MTFYDGLEKDYASFINYYKASGWNATGYDPIITSFIGFCRNNYPCADSITRQMIDGYLAVQEFKTLQTQSNYVSKLRMFTRHLCFLGKNAFVPDEDYSYKRPYYVPYIPNEDELMKLFGAIDEYRAQQKKFRAELWLPVIFRMDYCCGMRPAEPLHLYADDVNLKTGDIYIRRTKSDRERHITMSADLLELCKKYDALAGDRKWFFQYWDGGPIPVKWMTRAFRRCWQLSGNPATVRVRPYDLRHAFATHTIMNWIDTGRDIMSLLPFLSTYMGHAKISSTLYYVHLLPERLRKSSGIDWEKLDSIYRGEE